MLHQNQRIPLQNLLTLHPDLPIPPQSLPTTPLQNLPTLHQHPSPPTPPFPPIPPHNLSLTVPSLPTPLHNPLTVQCHPTPMRLQQSTSSTTTYQTAPPPTGRLPLSLELGRSAAG